jgi:type IV secretory pathway VirB3-like protein
MINTRNYRRLVRRSLLQRELLGGIPQMGLIGLVVFAVMFLYVFSMYFMIVPIVIMYFIMRYLTKKDPWLIDIVLDNIRQKDVFIP